MANVTERLRSKIDLHTNSFQKSLPVRASYYPGLLDMEDYSEVRPARADLRHGYGLSCSALGALTERLKNIQLSLLLLLLQQKRTK